MSTATYKCFDCRERCEKVRVQKRYDDGRVRCFACRRQRRGEITAYWASWKTERYPSGQNRGGQSLPLTTENDTSRRLPSADSTPTKPIPSTSPDQRQSSETSAA